LLETAAAPDKGGGTEQALVIHERAWEDFLFWQATDRKLLPRINALIQDCRRTPSTGSGWAFRHVAQCPIAFRTSSNPVTGTFGWCCSSR